ncbi:hypothetical protein SLS60_002057 [Paraconiothyrium brasiliense]|uniref:Uncharacterized protein n=1 Tax=Paraconiothyrium brasiliense TaxID=300254 RepID=A0ABR3S135_9PLEO
MGGFSVDNPDPRLRARAEMRSPKDTGSYIERLQLSTEPLAKDMTKAEPCETATCSAVAASIDDEKAITSTNNECTSKNDSEDSRLREFIAALSSENAQLAKEKADAIQKCADIQTEHTSTRTKYKDMHKRLIEINQIRINLDQSVAKRIQEKHEAVEMNEILAKENAKLLQVHADLSQESASLKNDNAELLAAVQPLEVKIVELQAEVASLKELQNLVDSEREQHRAIKAERDAIRKEKDALSKKVEAHNHIQWRDVAHTRGRSKARSRSPQRSPARIPSLATYQENYRGPRYRERSRRRSRHPEHEYQNYDQYRPEFDGLPTSPHYSKSSRPERQELSPPVAREPSSLLTPRETPETHSTTNSKPPHDFLNMGHATDASNDSRPSRIPTAPKADISFSMKQAKDKLWKRKNKNSRFRGLS